MDIIIPKVTTDDKRCPQKANKLSRMLKKLNKLKLWLNRGKGQKRQTVNIYISNPTLLKLALTVNRLKLLWLKKINKSKNRVDKNIKL